MATITVQWTETIPGVYATGTATLPNQNDVTDWQTGEGIKRLELVGSVSTNWEASLDDGTTVRTLTTATANIQDASGTAIGYITRGRVPSLWRVKNATASSNSITIRRWYSDRDAGP